MRVLKKLTLNKTHVQLLMRGLQAAFRMNLPPVRSRLASKLSLDTQSGFFLFFFLHVILMLYRLALKFFVFQPGVGHNDGEFFSFFFLFFFCKPFCAKLIFCGKKKKNRSTTS